MHNVFGLRMMQKASCPAQLFCTHARPCVGPFLAIIQQLTKYNHAKLNTMPQNQSIGDDARLTLPPPFQQAT